MCIKVNKKELLENLLSDLAIEATRSASCAFFLIASLCDIFVAHKSKLWHNDKLALSQRLPKEPLNILKFVFISRHICLLESIRIIRMDLMWHLLYFKIPRCLGYLLYCNLNIRKLHLKNMTPWVLFADINFNNIITVIVTIFDIQFEVKT